MLAVRIPKEIKAYKEKLVWGLNLRQIISVVAAIIICVPLYIWGNLFMNEEIVAWITMFLALPIVGFGFFKFNGMPFEKFVVVYFKQEFIFPTKRKFKTENVFRIWQNKIICSEESKSNTSKAKKLRYKESLKKSFLYLEAKEKGEEVEFDHLKTKVDIDKKDSSPNNDDDNKDKEDKKKSKKDKQKSKLELQIEEIKQKQAKDPYYLINNKERKLLVKWSKKVEQERINEIKKGIKKVENKNQKMKKRRTLPTTIPRTTQQSIPYIADYEEGMFEVEANKYSKVYEILDINYLVAKFEEQESIFLKYGEFLNYFSEEMNLAICIDNRVVSMNEQERKVFYAMKNDDYDVHRKEYNSIIKKQLMAGRNDIQQSKYITVTIDADSPYEAILRFHKIDSEIITNLRSIGSDGRVMTTDERLELLHDKFRKGREGEFKINYDFIKEQGISSKDYIAPSSFFFSKKYFMVEDRYCRCLYLNNLPTSLGDEFLSELTNCDFELTTTINIQPVAQDKALRLVRKQLTGMECNKIDAEKKAVRAGYSPDTISHELKQSLNQAEQLLDDMINKNQKMFFASITLMLGADSLEELEEFTKILLSKARKYMCQLQRFDWQQEDAYKVTLPMGVTPKKLSVERTLTTESTSIFMPFTSQELFQEGGFYYGLNQISRNLILCDRTKMKTPSGFIVGSSGSGKGFSAKREILNVLVSDDKSGVLVIDPENEYTNFAKAFGGTIIKLTPSSDCYINPMEMDEDYGLDDDDYGLDDKPLPIPLDKKKEKALRKKADYLMSIISFMISDSNSQSTITPQQKTIIDRSINKTYKKYLDNDFHEDSLPNLLDLQKELDKEKEFSEGGRLIAEAMEYYTKGSMNIFSHHSNLDFDNRFVVFNIRDLGNELKQVSLLIMLDFIWNRMIKNSMKKIRTYTYVDEIHVLFKNDLSAMYLQQLYKRGRKYGLVITGITQDVEEILLSTIARYMISNSDFIMMLNQSSENLKILAEMLKISENQMSYVSKSEAGSGLLFAEKTIVPFVDKFPEGSYLYKLMSTKFGEEQGE